MTRRNDDALRFIEDILREMNQAMEFVEDAAKDDFKEDERTVRAVVR